VNVGRRITSTQAQLNTRAGRLWASLPLPAKAVAVVIAFFVIAYVLPSGPVSRFMAPQSSWAFVLSGAISIYIMMALGLNVVVGYAGMLDLGYVGFYAVGGYVAAILMTRHHWNFWYALPLAIIASAISGLILGAPTLRLRGDYLAIVTLGFGLIVASAANNLVSIDGGPQGISQIPHPPSVDHIKQLTYGVLDGKPYFYLVLAALFVVVFFVRRLERSRVGRAWMAIREDEDVAELMGVPTYKFRLWSFAIGAAIGGTAGAFYISQANHIDPTAFSYQVSILVLVSVILGGSGNMFGVSLGAFVVVWLPERFRQFAQYRFLAFGAALVLMMIFRPEGLWPSRRRSAELSEVGAGGGMGAPMVAPAAEGEA
jgi:branched-chain amino acid transport system permease protein